MSGQPRWIAIGIGYHPSVKWYVWLVRYMPLTVGSPDMHLPFPNSFLLKFSAKPYRSGNNSYRLEISTILYGNPSYLALETMKIFVIPQPCILQKTSNKNQLLC